LAARKQGETMKALSSLLALALLAIATAGDLSLAQTAASTKAATPIAASASTAVPFLVPYSGMATVSGGMTYGEESSITFQIYKDEVGGEALWTETQTVAIDSTGHYKVQLGAANPNGLPGDLFSTGEARWLDVQTAGEPAQPRVLIASVPYALKAADATTLGGLPATAFALAGSKASASAVPAGVSPDSATNVTTTGGVFGYLPVFSGASTIIDSPVFVSGADVGIGTVAPGAALDVNGTALVSGALTADGGATVGGTLEMAPTGTATTSTGYDSQIIKLYSSAYNSSTKAVVNPRFGWEAKPTGNNSAAPSGTLNLLSSNSGAAPAPTGFSFNLNGTITFAPGQTFPASVSSAGVAVEGTSSSGIGVEGNSTSGVGVEGTSSSNNGVYGITGNTANTAGVYGIAGFASGVGAGTIAGVWGDSYNHVAVAGTSVRFPGVAGLSISNSGIVGTSQTPAPGAAGMFGTTGTGHSTTYGTYGPSLVAGVWGDTTGNPNSGSAAGVIGTADDADAATFFNNSSGSAATVYAENLGVGDGVYGVADGSGRGVSGIADNGEFSQGIYGEAGDGYAGWFQTIEVSGPVDNNTTLTASNYTDDTTTYVFQTYGDPAGGQASFDCLIDMVANLTCDGTIGNDVKINDGSRSVKTYSLQSAGNWFEDAGSAELVRGAAHVDLERVFGATVNTGVEYHVFLTPDGDSKGLYVSAKSAGGFDVRESGGGTSSIAFEYRIMAKRTGFENLRLEDVTDRVKEQSAQNARMRDRMKARPQAVPSHQTRAVTPSHPGTTFPQTAAPAPTSQLK
jgi:hypothetical protein